MLNERVQILISTEQRRRLEAEARRRRTSVASVIRSAIDSQLGVATRDERLRAVEEIRAMRGGRFLAPEELDKVVETEGEANLRRRTGRRR
jgi:hypothetical protein